jgi:DNA-binding response OmpR family regulator
MGLTPITTTEESPAMSHILLVEDEPNIAKGLRMVLQDEGYDVQLAMTGLSALKTFKGNGFNLVVADLRLPDFDGMDVLNTIHEERPETKMLVITGYPSVPSAVKAIKIGVSDYLCKPFTEDEFKTAVAAVLKSKKEHAPEKLLAETGDERLIQKHEVIRVLDRTARDPAFWVELMERGSEALTKYQLSCDAKAAIVSGDLEWIRTNIGNLNNDQLQFIFRRMEREAW